MSGCCDQKRNGVCKFDAADVEVMAEAEAVVSSVVTAKMEILEGLQKFSSYHTQLRKVSFVVRFIWNLRGRLKAKKVGLQLPEKKDSTSDISGRNSSS